MGNIYKIPNWVRKIDNDHFEKQLKEWDKKPMEEKYPPSLTKSWKIAGNLLLKKAETDAT
ncbi:MAG TPA: hypothetical protein VFM70_10740 [Salinimicrobium sp.]|nr:hypothetical protein [Salinimicrobium sp.]